MPKFTLEDLTTIAETPHETTEDEVKQLVSELLSYRQTSSHYERGQRLHKAHETIHQLRQRLGTTIKQRNMLYDICNEYLIDLADELESEPESEARDLLIKKANNQKNFAKALPFREAAKRTFETHSDTLSKLAQA